MKNRLLLFIPCILAILITGCTSTYVKKDFPSEEAFFKQISENSGSAGLIMKGDSIVSADRPRIVGDSIKWEATEYKFALDPNSVSVKKYAFPLEDVKAVTFTHHWQNNASIGAAAGMIIGGILTNYLLQWGLETNNTYTEDNPVIFPNSLPGAVAGLLAGGILGTLVGKDDIYILDDSFTQRSMVNYNYRKKLGLKIGRNSGFYYQRIIQSGYKGYYSDIFSHGKPGITATLFYNYPLSRLFSINSEFSFSSEASDATYSVSIPNNIEIPREGYFELSGHSDEYLTILELSPVTRLNLLRARFSPYLLLGPKFDLLFSGTSGLNTYISGLKDRYDLKGIGLSSGYRKFVMGVNFGAGMSTGDLFPVELLFEARYNYDITPRFETRFDFPPSTKYYVSHYYIATLGNRRMQFRSSEFQLNIGAAIF